MRIVMVIGHIVSLLISMFAIFIGSLFADAGTASVRSLEGSNPRDVLAIRQARTLLFLTLSFSEIFRCFTVRRFRSWFGHHLPKNRALLVAASCALSIIIFVANFPPAARLFSLTPIPAVRWAIAIGTALLIAVVDESIKSSFHRRSIDKRRFTLQMRQMDTLLTEVRSAHELVFF